jgi:16S rRNA (guanine527-N7)-methyltransferase
MSREPEEPAAPLPPERIDEILRRKAPDFSLAPGTRDFTALSVFLAELDRWRRKTNLTGALSPNDLAEHVLEALVGSELIANGERVIDIGSGAGFPGLPLAIVRADLSVTLLEPRGKRAAFLRHVVRTLGLKNTTVLEARIEEVGGQTFAVATTRAVGSFSEWIGQARFLDAQGLLLAWTTDADAVARELPGFQFERSLPVPGSARRRIAAFRKRL